MPAPTLSSRLARRREALAPLVAAAVVFPIALTIFRQGLNFLDDGVWLLGAQKLLDGEVLYRDFFTIYGPARFVVLAAVLLVHESSALGLALVEALTLAAAAGVGVWASRRQGAGAWSGLVLVGVLALGPLKPKLVAVGLVAVLWGWSLRGRPRAWVAAGWGLAWAGVASFGLDAALQAAAVIVLTVITLRDRPAGPTLLPMAGGLILGLAVPFVWAVSAGALDDFYWDAVVYPLTRFRSEMGISLLVTLTDFDALGTPFSTLKTGEVLPGFLPAHATWKAASLWLLAAAVVLTPLLGLVRSRGRLRDPLSAALVAFAISGWLTLGGRGDLTHLLGAGLGALWLAPGLLAGHGRPLIRGVALAAVLVLGLGPLLAENLWLALNVGRDGMREWERPRAEVLLPASRIEELERLKDLLPGRLRDPALFWPAQPGFHFVFDIPTALPQVTLLGGEVRDPGALVEELRRVRPPRVVLAARWRLGGRSTRELCPEAWIFFRRNYRVYEKVADAEDPFFVLAPVTGGRPAVLELPVSERLFDRRQSVANSLSPPLRGGRRVGQSLRVGDLDLSGLRVRWAAGQAPLRVPVQIVLWEWEDGALGEPFQGYHSEVVFEQREKISEFEFDPPPATARREIAITLERLDAGGPSLQLFWHEHAGGENDRFAQGTALVDGEPVDADLYFTTY